MTISYDLISALAPGNFHSGEQLAKRLGVTRKAVWKRVVNLRAAGVDVHAVRGKGYRLASPIELLDKEAIVADFGPESPIRSQIEILGSVDSTNRYAMGLARQGAATGTAVFAEWQTAGRGRRGRTWQSPLGSNLYFSVVWRFDPAPANLQLLGLALGVALAESLSRAFDLTRLGVKWPNDLYWDNKKLAGLLLEISGEAGGECVVIAGVGVNVAMPHTSRELIDQPWTDLSEAAGRALSRNRVAGVCLGSVLDGLRCFANDGFRSFLPRWDAYDLLFGRAVAVREGSKTTLGRAMGIDGTGALVLQTHHGKERFYSGDVSVRIHQ